MAPRAVLTLLLPDHRGQALPEFFAPRQPPTRTSCPCFARSLVVAAGTAGVAQAGCPLLPLLAPQVISTYSLLDHHHHQQCCHRLRCLPRAPMRLDLHPRARRQMREKVIQVVARVLQSWEIGR